VVHQATQKCTRFVQVHCNYKPFGFWVAMSEKQLQRVTIWKCISYGHGIRVHAHPLSHCAVSLLIETYGIALLLFLSLWAGRARAILACLPLYNGYY
jgi:hypothetical protein